MEEAFVPYHDGDALLEGYVAYPSQKRSPLVILCHAWRGRDEFICEQARLVASWGYVGFALDMYGKGILGKSKEENGALKRPFLEDRGQLQRRVLKAYETASRLPHVDPARIVVLGLGFGGVCALDLARSGVPLLGAISVYGHFDPPPASLCKPIRAKVLILHGYNDPVATRDELRVFEKELSEMNVDWQSHVYGNTMHAFATPSANDPAAGLLYNKVAAKRAWGAIRNFLDEIF
jgi:dienelactone hydrolase